MFNNTTGGYNLSDIAAVTGGNRNGGFGDDSYWWIILLFICFGNGGFGYGGGNGATTREEIAYGFDMNGIENGVRGIQQGLCDGFYAMNTSMLNGFNGVTTAINQAAVDAMQNSFGLQTALTNTTNVLGNGIHDLSTQMAACCCETKSAIDGLNYNLATQSCETRRAITDSTRQILDFLTQDKIASLTAENQNLKFAASQAAQNAYLISQLGDKYPIPAYVVNNPNA